MCFFLKVTFDVVYSILLPKFTFDHRNTSFTLNRLFDKSSRQIKKKEEKVKKIKKMKDLARMGLAMCSIIANVMKDCLQRRR